MFDIGFSEIILVMIVGLIVLGPERLPIAIKTLFNWINAMRNLATSVQRELAQELKLQELKTSLEQMENSLQQKVDPNLQALQTSLDELREKTKAIELSVQQQANEQNQMISTNKEISPDSIMVAIENEHRLEATREPDIIDKKDKH